MVPGAVVVVVWGVVVVGLGGAITKPSEATGIVVADDGEPSMVVVGEGAVVEGGPVVVVWGKVEVVVGGTVVLVVGGKVVVVVGGTAAITTSSNETESEAPLSSLTVTTTV